MKVVCFRRDIKHNLISKVISNCGSHYFTPCEINDGLWMMKMNSMLSVVRYKNL